LVRGDRSLGARARRETSRRLEVTKREEDVAQRLVGARLEAMHGIAELVAHGDGQLACRCRERRGDRQRIAYRVRAAGRESIGDLEGFDSSGSTQRPGEEEDGQSDEGYSLHVPHPPPT